MIGKIEYYSLTSLIILFAIFFLFYIPVEAIRGIRESLGVKKNWQGDPCFPADLHWDGVECEDIKSITTV